MKNKYTHMEEETDRLTDVPAFSKDPNNCGHWAMDINGKCQTCGSYGGLFEIPEKITKNKGSKMLTDKNKKEFEQNEFYGIGYKQAELEILDKIIKYKLKDPRYRGLDADDAIDDIIEEIEG